MYNIHTIGVGRITTAWIICFQLKDNNTLQLFRWMYACKKKKTKNENIKSQSNEIHLRCYYFCCRYFIVIFVAVEIIFVFLVFLFFFVAVIFA